VFYDLRARRASPYLHTTVPVFPHLSSSDKMAALSTASSLFVGKAIQVSQTRAKAPKASVVVRASASDNASKVRQAILLSRNSSRLNVPAHVERTAGGGRAVSYDPARSMARVLGCRIAAPVVYAAVDKSVVRPWRSSFSETFSPPTRAWLIHIPLNQNKQAVSLLAAGAVAFSASSALALNSIELQDERVVNKNGLQLIYEVSLSAVCR